MYRQKILYIYGTNVLVIKIRLMCGNFSRKIKLTLSTMINFMDPALRGNNIKTVFNCADNVLNHLVVKTQCGRSVKTFQCDGGLEFDNHAVRKLLKLNGVTLAMSNPYTPEQNGC
ncbi:PREDICTED: uncharacterized protein LOC105456149 [Wasmannia auropunctata]|uniref:uncharacterized protein LOC105456149 n=1 Tax=Wasmannia auropunctata TaxID=64793 RepID=UPI0005EDF9DB|nr:PREDICTED: uncharacterized protein LOC105456149 [Wasmannia auropunctata]